MTINVDNTKRFLNRVEDYIKYRPHYPSEIIEVLHRVIDLNPTKIIADIGSGTGISSEMFLKNGNFVYGIEPNKEMREAQELLLSNYNKSESIEGTAENTNLQSSSVDIIVCAQSFHWFDKDLFKKEIQRILKPTGNVVLIWNSRSTNTPFSNEYEETLKNNIPAYQNSNHREIKDDDIVDFFSPRTMKTYELKNYQEFNLDGLKGRLMSSSYCPKQGGEYEKLMEAINQLFQNYQSNGIVTFEYDTQMYWV